LWFFVVHYKMGVLRVVKRVTVEIFIISIAVLSLPIFLLSPVLFFPFWVWRCFVGKLSQRCIPNVVGLMGARNSVVAHDDLEKPEQSIVVSIGLSGEIEFEAVYEAWKRLVEKRTESGELEYPEFQRFYESWGGHLFWRTDPNFDMKNHARLYQENSPSVDYEEMKSFCLDLVRKPFEQGKSPWELILVNNYHRPSVLANATSTDSSPVSVLILRVHHGLCDGYSILEVFTAVVSQWEETKGKLPSPIYSAGARTPGFWSYVGMGISAPYFLVREGVASFDLNGFRTTERRLTGKLLTSQLEIPVSFVKEVKDKWGVAFSSVVFAAIAGGFRSHMTRRGMTIPEFFHVGMPFPWPRTRPNKLQNNMQVDNNQHQLSLGVYL
jgi:hypothetical protein